MRIALIQCNPLIGDLAGNRAALATHCLEAIASGASLGLAPELVLWGYPPRDLLLRSALVEEQQNQLNILASSLPAGFSLLAGVVEPVAEHLYNGMALIQKDKWQVVARKQLLPNYDVFDEQRYFLCGNQPCWININEPETSTSLRLGLTLCEDLWVDENQTNCKPNPITALKSFKPQLLINLSASPYGRGKQQQRLKLAAAAAEQLQCPVIYVNQVGGNDELIFDGNSFVMATSGALELQLPCAQSSVQCWDSNASATGSYLEITPAPSTSSELEELWQVLVLGLRDYAHKCGFRTALLGLSGGIDSALVACLAVAALGAAQVRSLLMPSPYSSEGSVSDAEALANRLGIAHSLVPIETLMDAYNQGLTPALGGAPQGISAENLQSRIRGTLLMAIANQEGQLLLATGNKSELAVGYCTLYGDMNGGLAVIGDLFKTDVFALAAWLDSPASAGQRKLSGLTSEGPLIGAAILEKAPSAELRPDQKDSDSLPDYPLLDPLLRELVEHHASPEQLINAGQNKALVNHVWQLLRRAEFKRRQAAPVLKVSNRSFGSGWRMPIASGG